MDRWVSFDCYGTLVDWRRGMLAALTPIAGDRSEALLNAHHGIEGEITGTVPHTAYRDVLVESLRRAAELERIDLDGDQERVLLDAWPTMPVFDDVASGLGALRESGWRLAVLTNCDDDLFATTAPSLGVPVDEVVTAEQFRSYKPRLAHFEEFARRSGADASCWVHVAGSWLVDMVPASRLDLPRIWVNRDGSRYDPSLATMVVPGLDGLPAPVLQALSTA